MLPRFSANIGFLFTDLPLLERIQAAADCGFEVVEAHWPYDHSPDEVKAALTAAGVTMCGLNTSRGNEKNGEAGLAAVPGRQSDFQNHFNQALTFVRHIGVPMIHVMAGIVDPQDQLAARQTFIENLSWAAAQADDRMLLIEPINTRDIPGYFLNRSDQAAEIITEIGAANVKMMFDLYHVQIMEGDLIRRLEKHLPMIGHIQFASVPLRHEPDEGEVAFPAVFEAIDALGYAGLVGAEYKPRAGVREGLGWGREFGLG